MLVPRFALAAHGQHEYGVDYLDELVEGNKAGNKAARLAADDQFALGVGGGPADQRIACQHVVGLHDFINARGGLGILVFLDMLEDTIDLIEHLRR